LAFTEETLSAVYPGDPGTLLPAAPPPYLDRTGAPAWSDDYPVAFRDVLPPLAGYVYHPEGGAYTGGYYSITEHRRYDVPDAAAGTNKGVITAVRDPLGREVVFDFDTFTLFPVQVTDPLGLTRSARYDYRVLQPSQITDANGNRFAAAYTPLGRVETIAVMGK